MKELWKHLTPANAEQVVVTWRDIQDVGAWDEETAHIGPAQHRTIGWFLYEGPDPNDLGYDILVIAKTYSDTEKKWADYTAFPKTVVKEVRRHEKLVEMDTSSSGGFGYVAGQTPEAWSQPETGGQAP